MGEDEGKYEDEDEDKRRNDNDKRKVREKHPTPRAAEPSTPRVQCISAPRVLHTQALPQIIDLMTTSLDDASRNPPPCVIHNFHKHDLEILAATNDGSDTWAREDDMTAACKQPACDQRRQRQNSFPDDGEAESAVEEVKMYILSEAKAYARELEKEIPELRQAAQSQDDYVLPCGSFQDTPVATKKKQTKRKKLAPALPTSNKEESKCKHPDCNIVAVMMLRGEEQRECVNCEREIEVGQYTGCESCNEVRCKECEWTWMYEYD